MVFSIVHEGTFKNSFCIRYIRPHLHTRDKNNENIIFYTSSKRASRTTLRPESLSAYSYSVCDGF